MNITLNHTKINLQKSNFADWKTQTKHNDWEYSIVDFLERFSKGDIIIELQTSGSTGKPKTIKAKKEYIINSAKATCEFFNLNKKSTALLCINPKYIGGQMMLVRAIVSGMNLLTTKPTANPVATLDSKVDFAAMVPYQIESCLSNLEQLNLIKNIIIGGGRTNLELHNKLKETQVCCYETFGMTETFSHIALRKINPTYENYFTCLANIEVKENNNNQLIIDAPQIGVNNLVTNDLINASTNKHFKWIGRKDNIINSGGIKIYPENIEKQISKYINKQFCILGLPNAKLGEQVVLIIEGNAFNTEELKKYIEKNLEKYHIPKQILFVTKFPLTNTGKIKREELKKNFRQA